MSGASEHRVRQVRLRLTALIVALAAGGVGACLMELVRSGRVEAPALLPTLALAASFAFTESFAVHVTVGRSAHSLTLSEIPLVLGLALVAPIGLIAARVVGGVGSLLFQGQRGVKLVFNLAHFFLEASLAVVVYGAVLGRGDPADVRGWIAAIAAVVVVDIVSALAVTLAIAIDDDTSGPARLGPILLTGLGAAVANTSVALLAIVVLQDDPRAVALLAIVALILFLAYRSYVSLSQGHARLELLYRFTRRVGGSLNDDDAIGAMLDEVCELLHAEQAELALVSPDRRLTTLSCHVERPGVLRFETSSIPHDSWWATAAEGSNVIIRRGHRDSTEANPNPSEPVRDGIAVPLRTHDDVVGVMLVANRRSEVDAFDDRDRKLLEAIANHAGVALENGRLVERLRHEAAVREHQALHDSLTDLPNRRQFHAVVTRALAETGSASGHPAVMLLDLDRFKEVNDTLGHRVGDQLLCEVGRRLADALGSRGTIARLGGDEFAAVITGAGDEDHAFGVASEMLRTFEAPFEVFDVSLSIGASIGLAFAPSHGDEAATLLQHADIAMYQAKARRGGVEVYAPERDCYSARWLSIVNALRLALDEDGLEVHYQPQAALPTGHIVGVEALVRWTDPRRGIVPPDEFIPIAEHTGLIGPLTRFVLRKALQQCAAWRAEGRDLSVSVNVSMRNVLDPTLPDDVERALAQAGVPARSLTIEITEHSLMEDPERAMEVLRRLAAIGVKLSLDDFGAGHASLAYLKQLPVDEVKIDKSFVLNLATDEHDAAIVRSTVDLVHSLGLLVVAEGVENEEGWRRLCEYGCDVAQGFLLSRAVPADRLDRWLELRPSATFRTGTAPDSPPVVSIASA